MLMPVIAFPFKLLTSLRRKFYTKNKVNLKTKVISVGNLSFGGSGKSQLIMYILEKAKQKKIKIGVVCGAYKSSITKEVLVNLNDKSSYFGDEPEMIKKNFPDVTVAVGPKKWKTALLLEKSQPNLDLILIDDGFQHLKLSREKDIVLIDASMDPADFNIFPIGRLRESKTALNKAEVVVLTKVNISSKFNLKFYKDFIKSLPASCISYSSNTVVDKFLNFKNRRVDFFNKKTLIVSAIGNPESFKSLISNQSSNLEEMIFDDHHVFTETDISIIKDKYLSGNFANLVCTEKDFIKLSKFNWGDLNIFYVRVKFVITNFEGIECEDFCDNFF